MCFLFMSRCRQLCTGNEDLRPPWAAAGPCKLRPSFVTAVVNAFTLRVVCCALHTIAQSNPAHYRRLKANCLSGQYLSPQRQCNKYRGQRRGQRSLSHCVQALFS